MNEHHTKTKGDLAVAIVIADLTKKGYGIFLPLSEHLPIDIIAYKDEKCFRIQCKYAVDGKLNYKSTWNTKTGFKYKQYAEGAFDYYAVYLPEKDVVCYPAIKYRGAKLTVEVPNSTIPFYWYEDFLDFTDNAKHKTYKDFGATLTFFNRGGERVGSRKAVRPEKEDMEKLVWEYPMTELAKMFHVSDRSINKWIKRYEITKPPMGYWVNHPHKTVEN
jgi:hypothetical protein